MTTTEFPETHDGRPAAVRHALTGQHAWREALMAQRTARPNHADFYDLAGALSPTLATLADLARVLHGQVNHYGRERPVYDDTRTLDPHVRLARAAEQLRGMQDALGRADECLEWFWSEIGHIGVEVAQ